MFSIASIVTMAACIFLFGLFYSIIVNFNYIVEKAEECVAITVLFDEDTTKEEKEDIGEKLEAADGVLKINYVSAEEARESFQDEYFKGSEEAAEGFKNDNPLANSDNYEVYMSDVSKQKDVVSYAESLDGEMCIRDRVWRLCSCNAGRRAEGSEYRGCLLYTSRCV